MRNAISNGNTRINDLVRWAILSISSTISLGSGSFQLKNMTLDFAALNSRPDSGYSTCSFWTV